MSRVLTAWALRWDLCQPDVWEAVAWQVGPGGMLGTKKRPPDEGESHGEGLVLTAALAKKPKSRSGKLQ